MQSPVLTDPAVKRVSYLDPTGHVFSDQRRLSARLKEVRGAVAALLDNGNDTSSFFFQALARVLQEEYGVSRVILETKFTSTKPADPATVQTMSQNADFMVAGVCL